MGTEKVWTNVPVGVYSRNTLVCKSTVEETRISPGVKVAAKAARGKIPATPIVAPINAPQHSFVDFGMEGLAFPGHSRSIRVRNRHYLNVCKFQRSTEPC
jgi:hypothetical protein